MMTENYTRRYFSRPPLRSLYFRLHTALLVVVLAMALVFGARNYQYLSFGGLSWITLATVGPLILWLQARRSHSKLYRIYEASVKEHGSDPEAQTALDAVLEQAAYLEDFGMYIASFVLGSAIMGVWDILRK